MIPTIRDEYSRGYDHAPRQLYVREAPGGVIAVPVTVSAALTLHYAPGYLDMSRKYGGGLSVQDARAMRARTASVFRAAAIAERGNVGRPVGRPTRTRIVGAGGEVVQSHLTGVLAEYDR